MAISEALEFGRRLRAARQYGHKDTGEEVTQKELAEATGYNRATIAAWERGEAPDKPGVRLGVIVTVSNMTGLPPEFFEVDFRELRQAIEAMPYLSLEWSPEQEIAAGADELGKS